MRAVHLVKIVSISSPKGGVGKTTLTANLGAALSNMGKKVLIVDCNIATPHLSLHFGLDLKYCHTINDVLRKKVTTKASLYNYSDTLSILPASMDLDYLRNMTVDNLKAMARRSFDEFDVVLLDSAPGMGHETITPLLFSDEAILVASPQIPDIIDVNRLMGAIKKARIDTDIRGLVLNKVKNKAFELSTEEIRELTGINVISSVPDDDNVPNGINSKAPIVMHRPHSGASRAFVDIARDIAGMERCRREYGLVDRIRKMLLLN